MNREQYIEYFLTGGQQFSVYRDNLQQAAEKYPGEFDDLCDMVSQCHEKWGESIIAIESGRSIYGELCSDMPELSIEQQYMVAALASFIMIPDLSNSPNPSNEDVAQLLQNKNTYERAMDQLYIIGKDSIIEKAQLFIYTYLQEIQKITINKLKQPIFAIKLKAFTHHMSQNKQFVDELGNLWEFNQENHNSTNTVGDSL